MHKEKLKLRKSSKLLLDRKRKIAKPQYTIDVFYDGEWMPAGDENGVLCFDTEEERNAKLQALQAAKDFWRR